MQRREFLSVMGIGGIAGMIYLWLKSRFWAKGLARLPEGELMLPPRQRVAYGVTEHPLAVKRMDQRL